MYMIDHHRFEFNRKYLMVKLAYCIIIQSQTSYLNEFKQLLPKIIVVAMRDNSRDKL